MRDMADLEEALELLKSGKLRQGMEILENLVRKEPENVNILYNLGMCYSESGSFDKSINTLEKCVRLAPEHANALTALGFSYSRKGEHEKALAKLKLALEIDPNNFFALKNHGAVLAKLGSYDEAITSLEKANRSIPDSPAVLYGLGLAYKEKGDTKAADELFKKITQAAKDTKITELAKTARQRNRHGIAEVQGISDGRRHVLPGRSGAFFFKGDEMKCSPLPPKSRFSVGAGWT